MIFIDADLKADAFGAWPYATDFGGKKLGAWRYATDFGGQKLKKDQTNMANIDRA